MQLSALFLQLPRFLANLTSPAAPAAAPDSAAAAVASSSPPLESSLYSTTTMGAGQKFMKPELPYDYNALEPHISEDIMKLHYNKHHTAYVSNLNAYTEKYAMAVEAGDVQAQIVLQQMIKFNGGGHINHSLFWQNLCPASSSSASPSTAPTLIAAIDRKYGSLEKFLAAYKALLAGIQGSGWGWLAKTPDGGLELVATKDQDPVATLDRLPIIGIDMWEHAYYLQYLNSKLDYIDNIWKIINWEVAEKRFLGTAGALKL